MLWRFSGGVNCATAGSFVTSTVDSPTEFYICCASAATASNSPANYYVAWNTTSSKFVPSSSRLTSDLSSAAKFIVIQTETAGEYKLYCTTNSMYLTYAVSDAGTVSNGQNTVTTTANADDAKNWKIVANLGNKGANFCTTVYDIVPAVITTPANTSPSWNFNGGLTANNLGFYNANDDSSAWIFVSTGVSSKNFVPSEAGTYYIDPVQSSKNLVSYIYGFGPSFGLNGTTSALHLGNVFKVTALDEYAAGERFYTIQPYYFSTGEEPSYVRCTTITDANANVTVATTTTNHKWRIIQSSTTGKYTIRPVGGSAELSWNCRGTNQFGTNNAMGLWTGGNNVEATNNLWEFGEVDLTNESTVSELVSNYKTTFTGLTDDKMEAYGVAEATDIPGLPLWSAYSTFKTEVNNATDAEVLAAMDFCGLDVKKYTSADNGIYTIKSKKANKYLFHKPDTKDITLLNDGSTLTQNYYFNLTFNDDGQITSAKNVVYDVDMAKGGVYEAFADLNRQVLASAEAPLALQVAKDDLGLYTGSNYFLLPNVHTSAVNAYTIKNSAYNSTSNPYYLTTWATTSTDNQYLFEKMTLEDGAQRYTVNINYNEGYTEEQVGAKRALYNGTVELTNPSYLYFSDAPAQSAFEPADATSFTINGYSVSGNTVNISYNVTMIGETERQTAQTLLNDTEGKVGYPAEAPRATLKAAVIDNTIVTPTQYANALSTFKASPDVVTPEPGKTYTISFRKKADNAANYYIYRETETGTTLKFAARPAEGDLPESAKFVCVKHDDGKYSFVPVKGGFLTHNGLTTTYTSTNSINKATFKPLVDPSLSRGNITDTSAENLFGYVCLTFVGRSTSSARSGCMVIQENDQVSNMTFSESDAPFLNGSFTSALLIEEVDYANHPTLLEIKGDKVTGKGANTHIGTFSAPFETTIPDGVTAYYAESDPVSNALVLTEITTGTIPANEGVFLLAATATPGYFVPAITTTTLTENKLLNSAGTPHTIVPKDYVLANANNVTAIYNATTGTTLAMNKAYLNLTPAEASRFSLSFDGSTTAIDAINAEPNNENGNIYDLSGRRVRQATKGIYVIGNKKVIVK